ncbi:restriction endonuclease subunit S [Anaerostipes hadrus]|uniref:restriction endonuclease subunit S n=1 Tax=Anaerostipes hadrus TaxID=649756 RepID=UPI00031DD72F|nr:restriction endonuclease subunit S [Anaerostipes hadrus]NSH30321.1 restriction endonuclease subunit S [Anaerostipes hadrus]NSH35152.1 restriction endonuclease subunit S [Anaerostipes hadrus]
MNKIKKYALSELYDMSSGISSTKEQSGHGAPFVSFKTVFNNYFLPEELPDLMDTNEKEQETYSIKMGDVFITRTSETIDELAMSCVAVKNYPGATYSGFIKRLRPKTARIVYPKYMAFYFRSELFRKAVTNNAFMTLRASFNKDIFTFLDIYLPDYHEQVKIGDMLYSIECKIQKNKKINDYLEEMANTIYDYWFVQFDFPDENGRPYKSSGGEMTFCKELNQNIPQNWGYTSVGNITVCFDSDRIPLSNHQRQEMKGTIPYYGATGIMDYVNCAIFSGDFVLLAEDGSVMDDNGNPILQRISGDVWINNHTHVLQPVNGYSCRLLYLLLKDIPVSMIKTGSIQMKINQANLNSYNILNIPDGIRSRFINQIEPIDTKIIQIQKENDNLKQIRNWLLPMLMNGQATIED